MNFLNDIRKLRKAKGWTQKQLAEISGIHQGDISKIESGKANVEVSTLMSLIAALNADFVLVPKRIIGSVQEMVNGHIDPKHKTYSPVKSVRDDLFIPDSDGDDDV